MHIQWYYIKIVYGVYVDRTSTLLPACIALVTFLRQNVHYKGGRGLLSIHCYDGGDVLVKWVNCSRWQTPAFCCWGSITRDLGY